ncbi:N-acyl homoserine lactonase family protein [Asanoa sp. WMMD1127]|uniref:N-acyl homoserine lactonase family protein n=1 Tax=Asanoa sp. WMMD1127 TaxID=3016107 RepID=UPI002416CAB3|nr:N-acyl homoserine lactonase family protein [Asanoa sp. WMMD1127]MDG4826502.1 N-acyl homoserine lactonase family protein [Asanoa sp. WMMD1127]
MGDVRRLDLGHFVRPADEAGASHPRVEPLYAYLVRRPEGLLLFDTGMGAHPDTDAHYRPTRRPLADALRTAGVTHDDITMIVNCHLHFDHCGGNPTFPRTPIVVQRDELATARSTTDYTLPELVDFAGVHYVETSGETELWPGVWIIPTPGHTDGHQSVAVRGPDGTVILAGQARDDATTYGRDVLAGAEPGIPYPRWIDRLKELDPRAVVFAHDAAVWMPGERRD